MRRGLGGRSRALVVIAACLAAIAGALTGVAAGGAPRSPSPPEPEGVCGLCVLAPAGQSLTLAGNGSLNVGVNKSAAIVDSKGLPAVEVTGNSTLTAHF